MAQRLADGVPAETVLDELRAAGISHVVIVPDTHQRTVLEALDESEFPVIRCAAENDVFGVCAGLWLAGRRPVALIQQLGIFAGVNALRGMVHDQRVPIVILAGLFGRRLDEELGAHANSAVRLCLPVLDALEIPWSLVAGPADAASISRAFTTAFDAGRPTAVLLGAPTT